MTPRARAEGQPSDRPTRLGAAMIAALKADSEYQDGDRAIVLIYDGQRGGIAMHGYDDVRGVAADLLAHVQAIFEANGVALNIGFGGDTMSAAVNALGGDQL